MKFAYDNHYSPPAPAIEIQLGAPGKSGKTRLLRAFVDTGADVSLVPLRYLEPLQLQMDNRKLLRSQWGETRSVDTYLVDVILGDGRLPLIEVVGDERSDEVILGRNVLNRLVITLNGPKQVLDVSG
jgi:predicted aspartyl protease